MINRHLGGISFLRCRPLKSCRRYWQTGGATKRCVPTYHLSATSQTAIVRVPCYRSAAVRGVFEVFCFSRNANIKGVDRTDARFGYLEPDQYEKVDLAKSLDLSKTFDLVICIEVIEHIPADFDRVLINHVVRHASKRIVFGGARPGQPGVSQINCKPISHWLELFASAGWYPCLFDSLALRSLATFPWLRSNLVVLTQDSHNAAVAGSRLMELEKDKIKWHTQHSGVITHPFTKTASKLAKRQGRSLTINRYFEDLKTNATAETYRLRRMLSRGQDVGAL